MSILSFKFRVKDSTTRKHLRRHAIACNQVWNFLASTQREAQRRRAAGSNVSWPSTFDLIKLCTGAGSDLGLHSDTVSAICRQFIISRDSKRKCPKFRASFGAKRKLGWVPFIPRAINVDGDSIRYLKRRYFFWKSRAIPEAIKCGSFVEDARGRWYVVFQCEVPDDLPIGNGRVGIDLGLKDLATMSDGSKMPALRHYRRYEEQLGVAQRAGNKRRVQAIHAKVSNARKHHLHEWSAKIASANSLIVVGNVSSSKLAKTKMAKSVLDAGWSTLRHQLRYKARRRGARYIDADERWSSQTCSSCGTIPASSPKGMGALEMRHWACSNCGASHDRDINAALNILRVGLEHEPPVEEILDL